jgi:hypothetical protein
MGMASDLELVHLAFNWVKELSLIYGDSIPHLISIFNEPDPVGLPFTCWPNNDTWNLLPTDSKINNQKSVRLPTQHKLKVAKERIKHWWQEAWLDQSLLPNQVPSASQKVKDAPSVPLIISQRQRFFAEANIVLPGLSPDNASIDDLFEALVMQRGRLKEMQQLREW